MPEILFIAIDPCILALVENLQELVEPRIWLESDYTSGIKRIFDTHPAIVFLQHKIGSVSCDKLANQVKMLLEGSPVPLVLLSEESVMSYSVVSTYEACFDLCLPLEELSLQIQQLLRTLPGIPWKESAQQIPDLFPSETTGENFDTLASETALQIADTLASETALQTPDALAPETTMELSLPAADADYMAFPWQETTAEIGAQFPPLGGATLEAFESNDAVSSDRFETGEQEPQFLSEFLEDRFVISPLPVGFDGTNRQDPPASYPASSQQDSRSDLRRLEKEDPRLVFEGLPVSHQEPSISVPKPIRPRPAAKKAVPAAPLDKANGRSRQAAAPRQAPPAENQTQRTISPPDDELTESVAASLGIKKEGPRYFRGLVIATLLITCIASLDLLLTLHRGAGPEVTQGSGGQQSTLKAPRPATLQLPQFIPQVAPDPGYPASHPGWERYQADGLEYLVYREKGSIAAVQVLSQQPGAISPPFLKTCIRVSAGAEQVAIKKTEERSGIQISTGTLQNGGELVVYKAVPAGDIRGFVISFPASQASARDAKK